MEYAHIFEAVMLICFGSAWPVSIYKTYKARSNQGKSVIFLFIILFGYINGAIYQYLTSAHLDYVFYLFFINMLMISIDIGLYYRNKHFTYNEK